MALFTLLASLTAALSIALLCGVTAYPGVEARRTFPTRDQIQARQLEAAKRYNVNNLLKAQQVPKNELFAASNSAASGPSANVRNITFKNPLASHFWVNGTSIPFVDWDVGPSWAGLLPISSAADETRKLFFWFFPPAEGGCLDDLILWTNGGPGCSSLLGLLQENGPISWQTGQAKPTPNQYSWTKISSVLWVEQPVGTGYSQGTPTAQNEEDAAAQLVGFLQQFLNVFSELKGKKFYLTGESYAGMYIPYIADYIYTHPTILALDLQGIWMADPVIGCQTFMKYLDDTALKCGYTGYQQKYATYPPKGPLPLPGKDTFADPGCDVWGDIFNASLIVNPAFNIYRIFDVYPVLWDVLGFPGSFFALQTTPAYFDRPDVKQAIHAPLNTIWKICTDVNVFPHGDASLPPTFTVLPNVIEKSKKAIIMHGLADYVLIADGARIAIQNMTWGGKQGFQTPIAKDSFIVDGIGALGTVHEERGFTYYEVVLSGHMYGPRIFSVVRIPEYPVLVGKEKYTIESSGKIDGDCDYFKQKVVRNENILLLRIIATDLHDSHTLILRQAVSAVEYLLSNGVQPENIQIVGNSAGGNLALAVLSHILHPLDDIPPITLKKPFAGIYIMSPWVLLSTDSDSNSNNHKTDVVTKAVFKRGADIILAGLAQSLTSYIEPSLAPEGWFRGAHTYVERFLITVSDKECMHDDITDFAHRFRRENKETQLVVQPDGVHDDPHLDFLVSQPKLGLLTHVIVDWLDEGFK
ncbi:Alpha/Beta hydrolase fold [Amanita muscaria]